MYKTILLLNNLDSNVIHWQLDIEVQTKFNQQNKHDKIQIRPKQQTINRIMATIAIDIDFDR